LRPARAFFSRNIQRSDLDLLAVYRKSIDELADRSVGSTRSFETTSDPDPPPAQSSLEMQYWIWAASSEQNYLRGAIVRYLIASAKRGLCDRPSLANVWRDYTESVVSALIDPEIKHSAGLACHICWPLAERCTRGSASSSIQASCASRENSVSRRRSLGLKTSIRRCHGRRFTSTA